MDQKETQLDLNFFGDVFDVLVKNLIEKKKYNKFCSIISHDNLPVYPLSENFIFDDIILLFVPIDSIMII